MRVRVHFMGPLADYVGGDLVSFDFPGKRADYGDLLDRIHERFGDHLPDRIWDSSSRCFQGGILVVGEGRDLDERETLLKDEEEIKVLPVFGGG